MPQCFPARPDILFYAGTAEKCYIGGAGETVCTAMDYLC